MTTAPVGSPSPRRLIVVRPAPRRDPPFDDELEAVGPGAPGAGDRVLPFAPSASPPRLGGRSTHQPSRVIALASTCSATEVTPARATRPTRGAAVPGRPSGRERPDVFGRRLLVALFEVLSARRPARQLAPYLAPRVYSDLTRTAGKPTEPSWRRHNPPVRSVHVCRPSVDVAEMCATVQAGSRTRAVAARLEHRDGRWQCVHLQLDPPPTPS